MESVSRGQPFCYMDMHGDLQICGGMAIEYGKLVVKVTLGPFGFTYYGTVKNYKVDPKFLFAAALARSAISPSGNKNWQIYANILGL